VEIRAPETIYLRLDVIDADWRDGIEIVRDLAAQPDCGCGGYYDGKRFNHVDDCLIMRARRWVEKQLKDIAQKEAELE
jgi:hypothetical protein